VWKIVAAALAAGSLSTLSRGSVLALGAGALTWFVLAPRSDEGEPLHRTRAAAVLIGFVVVVGIALSLGAEGLVERFAQNYAHSETRFSLWRDALKMVRIHPAGVGLGAFGRTYPVYQNLPATTWFQFPENQPLGILIESGIVGLLLIGGACGWVVRDITKHAPRDRVEASIAAGLVAVVGHNLTDFGLETLGVLLPFCAVLGALFGRQAVVPDNPAPRRSAMVFAATAVASAVLAMVLLSSPSTRDFDRLLGAPTTNTTRTTAHEASLAHPTDYLYALAEAKLEPPTLAATSTRLRLLNRAIILCPSCTGAHMEAARDLWRLGRHQQALLEWRTVLQISPVHLRQIFAELVRSGATAPELMNLVEGCDGSASRSKPSGADHCNRYQLSQLLLANGMLDAAKDVLAGASEQGVDFQIAQAQIALARNDLRTAQTASEAALVAAPHDPRAVLVAADVVARANQREKAIQLVVDGLRAEPTHLDLNRRLLGMLMQTDKWPAIDRALASLRAALAAAGAPMSEANIAAAHIFEHRGQYHRAIAEYQAAVAQNPGDLTLQLALARTAEHSGSVTVAIDAYHGVLRHAPDNAEARDALARIERDKKLLGDYGTHLR
jgi:tetratricopeptide (TPR) repeat protein